ncbi:hypothetical protein [Acetobacter pasteurianus]|uniref:Uncharacterized protein n=1 Tax=Acetobacter pasteurianus NBRC 3188 TaxID=1226663 RepID=A0A401WY65_ACEPA|nr:hypothetical protein [Acetobacter pasteurianus]GCD54288.1 hypothetical protein NBRC3188_2985 [Acetobacter pasteurianus NBRC 3188]
MTSSTLSAFHVTPAENLPSIMRNGLEPRIGPRSEDLSEKYKAIYLFPNVEAMENALANWMAEAFDDDETLAVIHPKLRWKPRRSGRGGKRLCSLLNRISILS